MIQNRASKGALVSAILLALGAGAQQKPGADQEDGQDQRRKAAAMGAAAAAAQQKVPDAAAEAKGEGEQAPKVEAKPEKKGDPDRPEPPVKTAEGEIEIAPDSPRAVVGNFLEMVRTGKEKEAVRYLQLGPLSDEKGAELARQLAAVLESTPTFDVEDLSPAAMGDDQDGLPHGRERIAGIKVKKGTVEPVRMVRLDPGDEWTFTARTVRKIPEWYANTPSAWAQNKLPPWFSKRGPAGVHYWQWFSLLGLIMVAWAVGFVLSRVLSQLATRVVKKTKVTWDDVLLDMLQGPVTLACSLAVAAAILPWLALPESTGSMLVKVLGGGFLFVFFWLCIRGIDLARTLLLRARFANDRPASRSLISLGARVTKAMMFIVMVIAVLSLLGLPVGSLLAGLGIGGLAVALAGQKTLENLIGTFAIGIDQPFREGDFVKVRDFQGTVEAIGLRSTRIRTLERTIITVPNGKLADEQLETYAVRDRLRLLTVMGLRYGSNPDQIRAALTTIEADMKSKWKLIDPNTVSVRLNSLGEWSMAIELAAMVNTVDGTEFSLLRQELLLHVMGVLEASGVKLQPIELVNTVDAAKGKNGSPPRSVTNV